MLCNWDKAFVSLQQAINAKAFLESTQFLEKGDVAEGFKMADHISEGMIDVGGQDHFYLECISCLMCPKEKGAMDVYATCQTQTNLQVSTYRQLTQL
jgi:xanthine dehydrogenase large subunit